MHFELIDHTHKFIQMKENWNLLCSQGAIPVPFLRHEYQATWWSTLGGGEWKQAELAIVTALSEENDFLGIAPFFFTNNQEGEPALMFLGSVEISDFLDFIVPPYNLDRFIDGLFLYLNQLDKPGWRVLDLYNLLDTSPSLPALSSVARQMGWKYTQECLQHSPSIPLPGDWETYLAGIDKKQRHEIRRKIRRMDDMDVDWRWYIVSEPGNLEGEINDILDLMALDAQKQVFLTETMRSQMQQMMKIAFEERWLQLAFLEINGEKAAGYINFDFDNHIWVYNSGFDLKYREFSPGWVLLGLLLKWANENKRSAFDFMRGNEDYKYRFGGVDRFVVRARIER
jgi:CelD/BcsL family acetyltransferase involved in cellulose biosynthesis